MRRFLFGIPDRETSFERRGFGPAEPAVRERLEGIGRTFLAGYHHSIDEPRAEPLARRLDSIELELRGWAYEGAAMGLMLLDTLIPFRADRLEAFVEGPGDTHAYMVHVGVGWAIARLRRRVERVLPRLDPLLGWLAVDGYGFHEGYFNWRRHLGPRPPKSRVDGYARRVFDQGLGRSLWFVKAADVDAIASTIARLDGTRHADLYSGVGLACAYAGGAEADAVERLRTAAGPFQPDLAQGAAFAAKARLRAGNPAEHTRTACRVLCGRSLEAAAEITDKTLASMAAGSPEERYEGWRRGIRDRLAVQEAAA